MITKTTIQFLKQLEKNNNKPWFDEHRKEYESAKKDFLQLTEKILNEISDIDTEVAHLAPKDCVFRINRDVRFSKNKSPYKTNMGMSIAKGGKKGIFAGYYFHLEPGKSFVGGGLYMPMASEINKVRQEIDYCSEEWTAILNNKTFKRIYGDIERSADISLSRPPKGYDASHSCINDLKLKSWIATKEIKDELLTTPQLRKTIIESFQALQPLLQFINRSIE
jgi:uncharacterized protein (TIGR02453 family)